MTDLAQPTATDSTKSPKLLPSDPVPLLLPLPSGAEPKMVYVKAILVGGTLHPGFALEPTSQSFLPGGVTWSFATDEVAYGLFVNFVLLDGIQELELPDPPIPGNPAFWFSEKWSPVFGQNPHQLCCTPIVAKATTEYSFSVKMTSGDRVDPKIIVTPFPGTGDGDAHARHA